MFSILSSSQLYESEGTYSPHYLAALMLYDQPYYFMWNVRVGYETLGLLAL